MSSQLGSPRLSASPPAIRDAPRPKKFFRQEAAIETKPHDMGRGRVQGILMIFEENGEQVMQWQPSGREQGNPAMQSYTMKYNLDDIASFSLRGFFRIFVLLKSGTTLPPFYSDSGFTDLTKFLSDNTATHRSMRLSPPPLGSDLFGQLIGYHPFRQHSRDRRAAASSLNVSRARSQDVKCRSRQDLGELGSFDVISMDRTSAPPSEYQRRAPLTSATWRGLLNEAGAVTDEAALRETIFHGGVTDDARVAVWSFLLHHHGNAAFKEERRQLYEVMKQQWASLTPQQLERSSVLRDRASRVYKDVDRTDRDIAFYDQGSPNLAKLNNILMTYTQYNFDLGYVQGMSDLASVLLRLIGDEVDTFWCFVGLMERMEGNFMMNQEHMIEMLSRLAVLLRFLDPDLLEHLERNDTADLFCCFRWMLIMLKREFQLPGLFAVWETILSEWVCKDYELFVCCALLIQHRDALLTLLQEENLKYVNEIVGLGDAVQVLELAFSLWQRFSSMSDIPESLTYLTQSWNDRQRHNGPAARDHNGGAALLDVRVAGSNGTGGVGDGVHGGAAAAGVESHVPVGTAAVSATGAAKAEARGTGTIGAAVAMVGAAVAKVTRTVSDQSRRAAAAEVAVVVGHDSSLPKEAKSNGKSELRSRAADGAAHGAGVGAGAPRSSAPLPVAGIAMDGSVLEDLSDMHLEDAEEGEWTTL